MDIGRAINCDLRLMQPADGGPLCFGPRTSCAVRVGATVDALAAQGVEVVVAVVDNPRRPLPEELRAVYDPVANSLTVPDLALDAGSHLAPLAVARAQYNVFRAVAAYLVHPPPEVPAPGDVRRQRPGFAGFPAALRTAVPAKLQPPLRTAFARLYAFKELSMVCPPERVAELDLGRAAPVPRVAPPDAPPEQDWERELVEASGPEALAAVRRELDRTTDAINHQLDTDLAVVLRRLAAACPPLHEHPFYRPPVPAPTR